MKIQLLNEHERERIHREKMTQDFHSSELKPLIMIERLIREGKYCGYSVIDEKTEGFLGYAFFIPIQENGREILLLDYFAVDSSVRSKGIGGRILGLFKEEWGNQDIVILAEVENPAYAPSQENRELRERRINFYDRSGFTDTGILCRVWVDEYQIIQFAKDKPLSAQETAQVMKKIYTLLFGERNYKDNVHVREA